MRIVFFSGPPGLLIGWREMGRSGMGAGLVELVESGQRLLDHWMAIC